MMLAFAEIRRSRGRFLTIIGALGLIAFLVLSLSALGDGLFYGSTGAYRTTTSSLTPVGGTSVLATSEAALAIPGVKEQVSTLSAIIYATLLVAAVVVALFFALVVLEKRELFAALKALGTSTRSLGAGVIIQALIASTVGVLIGAIASRLFGSTRLSGEHGF